MRSLTVSNTMVAPAPVRKTGAPSPVKVLWIKRAQRVEDGGANNYDSVTRGGKRLKDHVFGGGKRIGDEL